MEIIKKKVVLDRSAALAVALILEFPEVKGFADSLADSDRSPFETVHRHILAWLPIPDIDYHSLRR